MRLEAWPNATGLGPVPIAGARVQISPPSPMFYDCTVFGIVLYTLFAPLCHDSMAKLVVQTGKAKQHKGIGSTIKIMPPEIPKEQRMELIIAAGFVTPPRLDISQLCREQRTEMETAASFAELHRIVTGEHKVPDNTK